jgi:hypothetical protein
MHKPVQSSTRCWCIFIGNGSRNKHKRIRMSMLGSSRLAKQGSSRNSPNRQLTRSPQSGKNSHRHREQHLPSISCPHDQQQNEQILNIIFMFTATFLRQSTDAHAPSQSKLNMKCLHHVSYVHPSYANPTPPPHISIMLASQLYPAP